MEEREEQRISTVDRIDIWKSSSSRTVGSWWYVAATISTGVHQGPMAMCDGVVRLRHVEVAIKALVDLVKATPDAACSCIHSSIHSPSCNPPSFYPLDANSGS